MTEVVFKKRTGGGDLLWLDLSGDLPPASTYAIAYDVPGEQLPDQLTLSQTWNDHPTGVYLFLASTPADAVVFRARVASWLAASGRKDIRFLWVVNPDAPYAQWKSFTLCARLAQSAWSVARLASFDLANYALIVGGGCAITLVADPPPGHPAGFSFARVGGLPDSLRFTSGFGRFSYADQRGTVTLALSGTGVGTFGFAIKLPHDGDDADAPLAAVDAGLRYFVDDFQFPGSDLLQSFRFPVWAPGADLMLYGALDVVDPLSPTRSYLAFVDEGATGTPIESYWRTALGHRIALTPSAPNGSPGARLVFAANPPGRSPLDNPPLYLTPAGSWAVTTANLSAVSAANAAAANAAMADDDVLEPKERLLPGIAGTEYLGIMDSGAHDLQFVPAQAAYAPAFVPPGADPAPSTVANALVSLDGRLTTSWIYLSATPGNAIYYYAQPDDSEFYHAGADSGTISMARLAAPPAADFTGLALLEVPAAVLPDFTSAAQAFPAAPFAGLQTASLGDYRALELQALSPVRRQAITGLAAGTPLARPTVFQLNDDPPVGVTPQGLLGNFSADLLQWLGLTLAQTPRNIASNQIVQALQLANVTGGLKGALQTNQLFLVLTDPVEVLKCCSVTFRLTPDSFGELKSSGAVPPAVTDALTQHGIVDTFYANLNAYDAALHNALTPEQYNQYRSILLFYGAFADLNVEDWLFHVSPYHWTWSGDNPTVVLFKYANRTLVDLVNDISAWSWRAGAGGDAASLLVQKRLIDIVNAAIDAAAQGRADFAYFAKIAQSAAWNGILFLSVPISPRELPVQLQGLAAGIDPAQFFAHHLGIEVSPVKDDVSPLALDNSSIFGLIDYESPADLAYTGIDYDFKVLQLSVRFVDSRVASFASRIEVQLNTLFGSAATLRYAEHGNNIVLNGIYQRHGDTSSYVFLQSDENLFDMGSPVLAEVDIRQAQFFTLVPSNPSADRSQTNTRFVFTGVLRFHALASFDVFSYGSTEDVVGGLAFDSLILEMNFSQNTPSDRTFALRADNIVIDPARSVARPSSFLNHFPLTFAGFLQGTQDKTPADLGYMSVTSPLNQGRMDFPWFGLMFQLELGSLGALAASAGLTTTLIAAWSAADDALNVYVGLKMPGSVGAQTQIPIEGILKLNFKKIEIVVIPGGVQADVPALAPAALAALPAAIGAPAPLPALPQLPGATQYMLKFRGVSLNLLTLTFPPGTIDVYLFGNPETGDSSQLGWYAAYSKSE